MTSTKKIIFREWGQSVIGWMLIMHFYYFITVVGMSKIINDPILSNYIFSWKAELEIVLSSISFGILFSFVNSLVDRTPIRRKSFGFIILIKSVLYIFSMFLVFLLVFGVFELFDLLESEQFEHLSQMFSTIYTVSIITYFVIGILLLNFIIQVDKKFGPGILLKLLVGKYHKPKQEMHIFMFLDLKGSTSIAEKLGDIKYSEMIAACFHDITDIVIQYRAEIYQYVGDEVVLCWDINKGLKNLNCIKTFFAFENKLNDHKEYYLKNFGEVPQFKGGMDMGIVTLAEIGDIKRDIAYHGDVLNTAARIQGLCKSKNKKLLISGHLKDKITLLDDFSLISLGTEILRGKSEETSIYAIEYKKN